MKKKNSDNSEVGKKESEGKEASNILKRNLKSLLKQMDKEGLSRKDILKLLNGE
jgi:hypothetical protein